MEFSTRSMKQMIGSLTGKRVSDDAAQELGKNLEEWSLDISSNSKGIAENKGRKTVRAEDIREALRDKTDRNVEERLTR